MRFRIQLAVVVVGVAGTLVGFTPAEAAPPVGCGSVIRTNTTLTADVGPCSSGGLVVGASNVTLDLNGHTVSGDPASTGDGVGILVQGKRGVVVKNGTVRDFDTGVLLRRTQSKPTTHSQLLDLHVVGNGLPQPSPAHLGNGIALLGANDNLVQGNTVSRNIASGISIEEATGNTIRSNEVVENGVVDQQNCLVRGGVGIRLLTLASGNTVSGNDVLRNTSAGVNLSFDDTDNLIEHNVIEGNHLNGLRTSANSDRNLVRNNAVNNNGFRTVLARDASGACVASVRPSGSGIAFDFSNENVARQNEVRGNALDGIRVGGGDETLPSSGHVVEANTVQGNGRNGIVVTCRTDFPPTKCLESGQHNRIVSNTATGNGGAAAGTQVSSGGFLVGNFDLLDANVVGPPCDNNTWSANTFNTAYPSCTTG